MSNGFVNRWQGKVLAKLLGIGSGGITLFTLTGSPNIAAADLAALQGDGTLNAATTAALAMNGYGLNSMSSVGGVTYNLGAPKANRAVTIYSAAIGDGARKVSSTAAGATIQSTLAGAAFLNFSTIATNSITLVGISTAAWIIQNNVGAVTVSTS